MDLFNKKGIKPMLIAEQRKPFNSDNYLYELKFDGIRCVGYFDNDYADFRNKRDMKIGSCFPELQGLYRQVKTKCILDGELIVTVNGKPDFREVQRRAILRDSFKIKLAADKLPATFVVYDMLYLNDEQITNYPLIKRKQLLDETVNENEYIAISRYIEENGIDLYNLVVMQNLEGVVAKHKDSKYYFGKRSKDWIKFKYLLDDDYVICGYSFNNREGMNSVFLGQYKDEQLIYKGNVSLGVAGRNFKKIMSHPKLSSAPYSYSFKSSDKIFWIEPTLVATINFMHKTKTGSLRQPVFKGFREDKLPMECVEKE